MPEKPLHTSQLSDSQCRTIVATVREILWPTQDHIWSPDTLEQIAEVFEEYDVNNPEPARPGRKKKTG
jgi:hypothetical protein